MVRAKRIEATPELIRRTVDEFLGDARNEGLDMERRRDKLQRVLRRTFKLKTLKDSWREMNPQDLLPQRPVDATAPGICAHVASKLIAEVVVEEEGRDEEMGALEAGRGRRGSHSPLLTTGCRHTPLHVSSPDVSPNSALETEEALSWRLWARERLLSYIRQQRELGQDEKEETVIERAIAELELVSGTRLDDWKPLARQMTHALKAPMNEGVVGVGSSAPRKVVDVDIESGGENSGPPSPPRLAYATALHALNHPAMYSYSEEEMEVVAETHRPEEVNRRPDEVKRRPDEVKRRPDVCIYPQEKVALEEGQQRPSTSAQDNSARDPIPKFRFKNPFRRKTAHKSKNKQ